MEKELTKQKQDLRDGNLKMVGILLNREEIKQMQELQGLANELYPYKNFSNNQFFRFLLSTYGERMKAQLVRNLAERKAKEDLLDERDF